MLRSSLVPIYFHTLPVCPQNKLDQTIAYPSVSFLYLILALSSIIFCIIVGFRYNSVEVFHKKIRTQNISNTVWIAFYFFVFLRGSSNCVRYAVIQHSSEGLSSRFEIASLILQAITALILTLALNHQRKYRSSPPPLSAGSGSQTGVSKENDPLLEKYSKLKRLIGIIEITFFSFFLLNLIGLYLFLRNKSNDSSNAEKAEIYFWTFMSTFILQRIPIIILTLLIAIQKNKEGPTKQSKIFLLIGTTLNIVNDLPLKVWAGILPDSCVFVYLSWVDVIHILYFSSLLFYFLFLRSEYLRNKEECIWSTVSQIQDTFDFRKF